MIREIVVGDITAAVNRCDIIIGMNTELGEVSTLGRRVLANTLPPPQFIDLGTVLTFKFDQNRFIHMLICHNLCSGGWERADQFVRVGLDHLWVTRANRNYGIVQIGRGLVGRRDGAEPEAILTAIASSYLPVDLYVHGDETAIVALEASSDNVLEFTEGFSPTKGAFAAVGY